MSVFEHGRFKIVSPLQHPYKHSLSEYSYSHSALGTAVSTVEQALDWIFNVLYPYATEAVDTYADLPAVGNTINDFRIVLADENHSNTMTGYRWEQREGDASAEWKLVYKLAWGETEVISGVLSKTQDMYVYRHGYDDVDKDGVALTGVNAGQHIYGGASASSHLNLHANSGDGVGAQTGYIQAFDNMRPSADSTWSLGTTTERWLKIWTDEIQIGTMVLTDDSITSTDGAISFGDDTIATSSSISAGTLTISSGTIVDSGGVVSFGDEIVITTGNMGCAALTASAACTLATGTTIGTLTLADASITDSGGTVGFGSDTISTSGSIEGGSVSGTTVSGGNLTIASGSISDTSGNISLGDDNLSTTGIITAERVNVNNIRLDGNTVSSTDTNGNVIIDPNGSGLIEFGAAIFPTTTSEWDIGKTGNVWNDLWIDGNIQDGTNTFSIANLMTFRAVGTPNSGDGLFWDGSKWVASAPDTEIDHGTISGLTDSDDHTQYVLLAGRTGGTQIYGSDTTTENLTLSPNSADATGSVIWTTNLSPAGDNAEDIGGSSNYIKDLYIKGQLKNARLENFTTAGRPSASASYPGRIIWDTDLEDVFIDKGGTWLQLMVDRWEWEDDTNWDGATSTVTYTVDGSVEASRGQITDARKAIWQFKDNSNNHVIMDATIDHPAANQVRVTFDGNLPAGTYRLIGIA